MDSKAVAPAKTLEEIRQHLAGCKTKLDPDYVLREADKELSSHGEGDKEARPQDNAFKAMTLFEFDNGVLLSYSFEECYKIFAIDLLRKLRAEYGCQTPSENTTAELAVLNYVRTLEIQQKINNYLGKGSVTDTGVKFLQVMSQELDRANRQYLATVQALKTIRMPQMQLNIKAQTAVIGQNQLIQSAG